MNNIFKDKKDLTKLTSIRIKESIFKKIETDAKENNLSFGKVVNLILENYYKKQEE